jgi:hypothetical protein
LNKILKARFKSMRKILILKIKLSLLVIKYINYSCWVLVAHASNPNYSGGRDQEDRSSKPAWANSLQDPVSKKPFTEKGWWSGSRCRP